MEAGVMKIVLSINRSWTRDSYFSVCRPIHRLEKSRGNVRIPMWCTAEVLLGSWF